jgi:hypothetical protein
MGDTFTMLNRNEYVSSGPTKFDHFKKRSNTIVPIDVKDMDQTLNKGSNKDLEGSLESLKDSPLKT